MEDILALRCDRNDAYTFFCLHFLRPCVTDRVWRLSSHLKRISDETFVTKTDEAFCLLVLENNWDF